MFLKNYTKIIILFLYISLLLGVYYNEDIIGGAYLDFKGLYYVHTNFRDNFNETFFNYDKLGLRHSPVFYIIGSIFSDSQIVLRLFFIHVFLLIPIFFYKTLKIIFK